MKRIAILTAAVIAAFSLAVVASAAPPTAKLVGTQFVNDIGGVTTDQHFTYENITDGDPNGLENQLNSDCTGDGGSIDVQIGNSEPTAYPALCVHYLLADAGTHKTLNFAYQSGANQWKVIRWLGTKNKLFTVNSAACAIKMVNMGPQTAGATCVGQYTQTYYRGSGPGVLVIA